MTLFFLAGAIALNAIVWCAAVLAGALLAALRWYTVRGFLRRLRRSQPIRRLWWRWLRALCASRGHPGASIAGGGYAIYCSRCTRIDRVLAGGTH